jgi:PAS domain S-box-containing protein
MDSLPTALYRTTIEGKIVFCNRKFARIFGFETADEMFGFPAINLYRNKKDRGILVHLIMQNGAVYDLPLPLVREDGTPIWCTVTARAVLDDDDMVVNLDGVLQEITDKIEEESISADIDASVGRTDSIILLTDVNGTLLEVNEPGARLFGYPADELRGKPLSDYIAPKHRELFMLFTADILKFGSEQIILPIIDSENNEHQVEFQALLIRQQNRVHHIKVAAKDVTQRLVRQKANSSQEKFQGVLEMAGGVAHRLNQPLTIINNILNEINIEQSPVDNQHDKIQLVKNQVKKMTEITNKISNIRHYASMDYVAGIKIVDIDKAS